MEEEVPNLVETITTEIHAAHEVTGKEFYNVEHIQEIEAYVCSISYDIDQLRYSAQLDSLRSYLKLIEKESVVK